MKLPLSWLTEYVDLDLDVDQLVDVMSMHGLEVEEVTTPGAGTHGVRTARVLDVAPHPDADNLVLVQVTGEGGSGDIDVVCGASNFSIGDVVLHAPPGASIPGMSLEARKIRGRVSNGMLCSARELQLGDDHAGIVVLGTQAAVGVPFEDLVAVGEPVIEIAVQADRGDHLGIIGVARDLGAILDVPVRAIPIPEAPASPAIDVDLDTDGCARFVTWALENVPVQPSPLRMRQRLAQCGIRPIDIVVDVTNYVMLETGQPLHAFDHDALTGSLVVREAAAGEQLVTLDDVSRQLDAGDLVIADDVRLASLAGVMGGRDSEVRPTTTRVLLEGAVWEPRRIRATSRRLGLVSEASNRFARRVDPEGAAIATARAAGLLQEHGNAQVVGTSESRRDPMPGWAQQHPVTVRPSWIRSLLGMEDLDDARQLQLLARSGAVIDGQFDGWEVRPPSWRGDLARPADFAEEVARLHGYDRIPAEMPHVRERGGLSAAQRDVRTARDAALAAGFFEAVTRPFVGNEALVGVVPSAGRVRLSNPLAQDAAAMRPSLVEGLLAATRRNVGQGRVHTALIEIGRIFRPVDDPLAHVLDNTCVGDWRWLSPDGGSLPVQPQALGLVAQGHRAGVHWLDAHARVDVFDVLAVFDEIVRRLAPQANIVRRAVEREGFHPGQAAGLFLNDHEIGFVAALHPDEAERRDLPEPVIVGEIVLEPLIAPATRAVRAAQALARHPAMVVDVALVADDNVPYAQIEAAIRAGAGGLLDDWWWFDEYRGAQIGDGARSVAVRLRLQDPDRQLTDEDAEAVIEAIAEQAAQIGATLRR